MLVFILGIVNPELSGISSDSNCSISLGCCCNSPPSPLSSSRIVKVEKVMLDDAGDDTRKTREGGYRVVCSRCARRTVIKYRRQYAEACCRCSFDGRWTSRLLVPPWKGDSTKTILLGLGLEFYSHAVLRFPQLRLFSVLLLFAAYINENCCQIISSPAILHTCKDSNLLLFDVVLHCKCFDLLAASHFTFPALQTHTTTCMLVVCI